MSKPITSLANIETNSVMITLSPDNPVCAGAKRMLKITLEAEIE